MAGEELPAVGETITAAVFKVGDIVDVVGTSKGRGFAGTIKRHGFHRGPETHGCMNVRQPGSIASRRIGKLPKGKRMGGHYGVERCTTKNLKVVHVDEANRPISEHEAVQRQGSNLVWMRDHPSRHLG